jgi:hypothetical protein
MKDGFDDEDFVVDDIISNRDKSKKAKKKVNGKQKGSRVERELTKMLNGRFNCADFSRSVGSGNRWSQVNHLPKHARDVFSGDLIVPGNFKFCLESKGGYDNIDLNSIFHHGSSELDSFLEQSQNDATRCDRKPMLCWKRTRRPWLVFLKTDDLEGRLFKHSIKYGDWTGVSLETLLQIEDGFFLKLD